jgi:hypothetical protein
MALPSKREFLATNLEPVERADCPICQEETTTSPVRLPCQGKHEFCKGCITTWFKQPDVETCPMCRQRLFDRDTAEPTRPMEMARLFAVTSRLIRRREVLQAIRAAGLGGYLEYPDFQTRERAHQYMRPHAEAFTDALNLDDSIRWSHETLHQLVPRANDMLQLAANEFTSWPGGVVRIDLLSLGACLNIMVRVQQQLATARNRPWSDVNRNTLKEMVMVIWRLLAPEEGLRLDRRTTCHTVMASLYDNFCSSDFLTDENLMNDLRLLIMFTLDHAGPWMSTATLMDALEAGAIPRPSFLPRTASAGALRSADSWFGLAE